MAAFLAYAWLQMSKIQKEKKTKEKKCDYQEFTVRRKHRFENGSRNKYFFVSQKFLCYVSVRILSVYFRIGRKNRVGEFTGILNG